ncbi:hypothetical protein OG245_37130 [Streptomyces sp. NBC_01116]|uniref:hypothetical protein n=1 Tax=Streptomyces sp. NBC_01116 TaxID=2903752 RepID=UPI0032547141
MTTPAPAQLQGEPFSEALSEAAQAAGMSVRLILAIADAVRCASQKHHHNQEQDLSEDLGQIAESWWSADELGKHLPESLLDHLTGSEDWPVMARQLISLSHAGVDLTTFLPNLGTMASGVEQAVARNTARIQAEGTDRWADLLRTTIPEGLVRDAILASPAWPDIAATMGRLHDQGVDVARILNHAHTAGLNVDQAIAAAVTPTPATTPAPATAPAQGPATAPPVPPRPLRLPRRLHPLSLRSCSGRRARAGPCRVGRHHTAARRARRPCSGRRAAHSRHSAEARPLGRSRGEHRREEPLGPLAEGLNIPRDLDFGNRARALDQLGVTSAAHRTLVTRSTRPSPRRRRRSW